MAPLVVVEGLDGAGKSSQVRLLLDHLERVRPGTYHYISFPRTDASWYGVMISRFLRGEFGSVDEVDPYFVAMLFAGDRRLALREMETVLDEGKLLVADRYVFSNVAFQCAKVNPEAEQQKLRDWILHTEFVVNCLPHPDLSIYLDVPLDFVERNLARKRTGHERKYLVGGEDIHEGSLDLQRKVAAQYESLVSSNEAFAALDCADAGGQPLSTIEVHKRLLHELKLRDMI